MDWYYAAFVYQNLSKKFCISIKQMLYHANDNADDNFAQI